MQKANRWQARLILLPLLVVSSWLSADEPARSLEGAWTDASRILHNDAYRAAEALSEAGVGPEADLARAILLLSRQPKTQANVVESERILESVAAADSELRPQALYVLGRIAQYHLATPDYEQAMKRYDAARAAGPESFFGELAFVRRAIIRLIRKAPGEDPVALLASLSAEAVEIRRPEVRRGFHAVAFDWAKRQGLSPSVALEQGVLAERLGLVDRDTRSFLLVGVATTAEEAGERATAIAFYETFLRDFPRDNRAFQVRQRLEELNRAGGGS